MHVLIADDEPLARSRLKRLLMETGLNAEVSEAASAAEARNMATNRIPDLVLLDIAMPGEDGLSLAEFFAKLPEPPAVIFVTAYSEHALAAFNVHAVDYLLKPVTTSQLKQSLQRAYQLNRLQKYQSGPSVIRYQQSGLSKSITLDQVLYFSAEDKYVRMYMQGDDVLLDQSLNQLAASYPQLLRIHRQTLINPLHLTAIRHPANNPCLAELAHGRFNLPISRRALSLVKQALNKV
ncbi:DNA-binding response regulator [Alishewanella longhuensis]|uniref:DNA-binding response regulator n=1 Tax=Alishewanella longhuensis TaxID=1091037 RepID=A0ABQ3L0S3_9ALTE|nr:LytTR family DNA-binding domain-containing protein [Alishewanella longhuensis]GHG74040.1 DNA-binding response regulator [Alishewanella longhuensis]